MYMQQPRPIHVDASTWLIDRDTGKRAPALDIWQGRSKITVLRDDVETLAHAMNIALREIDARA